jgi:hypothetical protein
MNGILSSIGGSLFQALTGQDPNAISAQLTQAEQQLTLVAEVVVALLFVIAVGQWFIIAELRRR